MTAAVSATELRRHVGRVFATSWATRDAVVREANNQWAPATVIRLLMAIPDQYYRSFDELLVAVEQSQLRER